MIRVIQLELRKHWRMVCGVGVCLLVGVLGTAMIGAIVRSWDFDSGLAGGIQAIFCAIPVLAAIIGATCGAALRRDPQKSAEEPLPARPLSRVAGAFVASLIYFIALALIVPTLMATDQAIQLVLRNPLMPSMGTTFFWWIVIGALHLHLLSFILAYWLKQPIWAAGLAMVVGICEIVLPIRQVANIQIPVEYRLWDSALSRYETPHASDVSFFLISIVLGIALTLPAARFLAMKLDRDARVGIRRSILVGFLLLSGIVFSLLSAWNLNAQYSAELDRHGHFKTTIIR
jgi:hypothetical protein